MKKIYSLLLILIIPLFFFQKLFAFTAEDEAAVKDAYYQWCSAIGNAKGNPDNVIKFYAHDAILLPTLSNEILVNNENGFYNYFKKLTGLTNIKCTTDKLITHMYKDTALNAGFYTFTYTSNGKEIIIPARFTFLYEKENNQWLIIKHHSSMVPEDLDHST